MISPNDWEIKKCLHLSLAVLLAMLGLVGLGGLGYDVLGLRQIIGFVFLTFIPGILILRILKIHNVGIIESLLYSVGLSLAFVMFSGLFMNFALPLIGISKPISILPIVTTLTIFIAILMAVAYMRDKGFSAPAQSKPFGALSSSLLFLILVFLLAILGALMVNFYHNSILLLIFIILVAGIVGLAAFGKFIDHRVYPLATAIIAICLLYQTTLLSPYLTGTDIHGEYYFQQLVVENSYWDASLPYSYNNALSIVMLAPIYSLILNTDAVWLFKIIYPFIFSLVPLALFHIYRQQISDKKAFLAVFFFIAVPTFSLEMIALARQQIAELFFALFILLMVDRKLVLSQRLTLAIVFGLSMAVSHYGLGGVCLFYFALGWLLLWVIRSGWGRRVWGWLTEKFGGLPRSLLSPGAFPLKTIGIVVVIYFACSLAWYGWAASGVSLRNITGVWQQQATIATSELPKLVPGEPGKPAVPGEPSVYFDFTTREPLVQTAIGLDFASASTQGKGFRIFQYITQLFIVIGFIRLIFRPKKLRFTAEFIALTGVSALLLLACIFLPWFSYSLNVTRLYHIALFLLAPLCILGGEAIWLGIGALCQKLKQRAGASGFNLAKADNNQAYLRFLTLAILIPYFLFTSGFVFEVTGHEVTDKVDTPYSIALSSYRVDVGGVFNWQDGAGADWLAQTLGSEHAVYADWHSFLLLYEQTKLFGQLFFFPRDMGKVPEDSYFYFRTWNIDKQEIILGVGVGLRQPVGFNEVPELLSAIECKNRIYDNGGAQILAPR